jgi:hypothetical protein
MRINGAGFPCSSIYAPSVRDASIFDIARCPIRRPGFVDRVDLGIQVCPVRRDWASFCGTSVMQIWRMSN